MSAQTLRDAAARLRELAEGATSGPWWSWVEGRDGDGGDNIIVTSGPDLYVSLGPGTTGTQAVAIQDYIAAMSPPVALALADWLEAVAEVADPVEVHLADVQLGEKYEGSTTPSSLTYSNFRRERVERQSEALRLARLLTPHTSRPPATRAPGP